MNQPTYSSGLLFTRAHKAVRSCIYDILGQYNLTPSHWTIISITLASPDGVRLSSVAKQMDVKAPLVTMLADELIAKWLIDRIPHHTDRRAKLLVLTPTGKKTASKIEAELNTEIMRLMNGVSKSDAAAFQRTLETIIANSLQ